MKKSWKQWMAITCALAMIVSLLPVTILAEEGVATPTDLAPVVEPVQETEPAEEEKVTYTARIAAAQRDGKIYLTVAVEPEYTGTVIWEKKTQGAEGEKWVMIDTTSTTLMILPGSDLIGKEIRFRLEDGTTPVLNYVVPELEPVEEPAEGYDEPVVEINQEEAIEENETEPAAGEAVEEPVTEEEQEIEDYETPLGLDDAIVTEPEVQEEPADEPAEEEPIVEQTEEEIVVEVTEEIPAEEETEAADDDLEIEVIDETPAQNEAPAAVKAEESSEEPEAEEIVEGFDVREEADGMSAIFTTLPFDAEITVLDIEGDWVKVDVDGQIGYIYVDDLKDYIELPETEPSDEMKVMIFTSRRAVMVEGEPVYLTSRIEGFDGYEIMYQWECDKHDGAGFIEVEGANDSEYSYSATVETLRWDWRLSVYYR